MAEAPEPFADRVNKMAILLHGLDSDGASILKIGQALKGFYPDIRFAAPDATFDGQDSHGQRWFDPTVAGMGLIKKGALAVEDKIFNSF